MWSGEYGKRTKYRIIFPIYMNNKLVNWCGKDITENKRNIPYIFALDSEAVVKRAGLIFNYDNIKTGGSAIFNEGIFDSCRVDGAGLLSVHFTSQQILKIKEKKLKNAYLMMDNDEAGRKAQNKLESQLSCFVDNVFNVEYDAHDPDELDDEEIKKLKMMIC